MPTESFIARDINSSNTLVRPVPYSALIIYEFHRDSVHSLCSGLPAGPAESERVPQRWPSDYPRLQPARSRPAAARSARRTLQESGAVVMDGCCRWNPDVAGSIPSRDIAAQTFRVALSSVNSECGTVTMQELSHLHTSTHG